MSVENFDQIGGAIEFLGEETPENCFYCGKPLAGVGVLWFGAGKAIGLHRDCASSFGAHIIKDSLHANRLVAGKPILAGIGVGLAQP